jgi:predicted permease
MEGIIRDLRYSFRAWRKRPGFNALIVGTLALAIGANGTVFSVIDAVLLRSLPYEEPERLAVVRTELPQSGVNVPRSSGPEILDLRERATGIASLGGLWARPAALTDDATEPEEIEMGFVTAGFLSVLGLEPLLGRDVLPEEDVPNAPKVVVLSHGLWQRRYGADPSIVGKTISMDGEPFTVVGVMPESFRMLMPPDAGVAPHLEAWVPWGGGYEEMSRAFRVFTVVTRLAPGVALEAARAELEAISGKLVTDHAQDYTSSGLELRLEPLQAAVTAHVRPALVVLWATVAFVLVIACANVANLLLVRASGLEQESSVRQALGASRARIVRELLVDSLALAAMGGALGLVLARWGVSLLKWLSPAELPRLAEVSVGASVVAFSCLASLLAGAGIGLVAALHLSRARKSLALRSRSIDEKGRHRLRRALVVSEVGLSLVLLIGAGLLVRSFRALSEVELGYETSGVSTLKLSLIDSAYPYSNPEKIGRFYRELLQRVSELPQIEVAGATTALPLEGASPSLAPYSYESDRGIVEWDTVAAEYRTVTPGWLEALRVPLLEGRLLQWTDDLDHPNVVVVDERLARAAWPGESAVGKRLRVVVFLRGRFTPTWCEVVGVVGHVKNLPGREGAEQVFLPHTQSPQRTTALAIRTTLPLAALGSAVREEVRALEPTQPIHSIRPMDDYRSDSVATHRFTMTTLGAFAAGALVLAALGVYGVMAFTVSRRTSEIGLRMALGAGPRRILVDVLEEGLGLVGPGIMLGLVAALLLSRFLSSLLFGVTSRDPWTFVGVALFLAAVAGAACYFPGRRAASLNPLTALREE